MLTVEQVEAFERDGFVKGDVVLNDEEVELLRRELDLVLEGGTIKKPVLNRNLADKSEYGMSMEANETIVQVVNIWMASDLYLQHAANRTLCEDVAQLAGTDTLRIWHDQIQYKPPVTGGPTKWHQDHPLWPIIKPSELISAWVALDDAVIENGCMWMVPGSHTWGDHQRHLLHGPDHMPQHKRPELLPEGVEIKPVPFEIKKGQVGYHHCMTWHGSLPNTSQTKRRAIAVHYMPGNIRYEPTGNHPMSKHIHVQPGELLTGADFPVVYTK